jgi:subtilisin family serine protease
LRRLRIGGAAVAALVVCGVLVSGAAIAKPATSSSASGGQAAEDRVIVKFRSDANKADEDRAEGDAHATEQRTIDAQTHVLRVQKGKVDTAISRLRSHAKVSYAEPDFKVHADVVPTAAQAPSFHQLWGLQNTGQTVNGAAGTPGADISATKAWDVTTGSSSIVVGVVDTGVNYNHPNLVPNIWSAGPGGVAGCPAGAHGYNAITHSCDPLDDNDHGSHVSGTIGAAANGTGVVGINWNTSIMGLKFLDSTGSGFLSDAITAIDYAVQAKQAGVNIRVLNNSWGGGGYSQALLDEINKAGNAGILFVVAAGNSSGNNDSSASYPCSYQTSNMICVAATDQTDKLAYFSNYGHSSVALGAPGTNILSTVRSGYAYFDGTSMATPHVTGSAALVLSSAACASQTTAQLKSTILNNVDAVPSLAGVTQTGGRLDVFKAVSSCVPPAPPSAPTGVTATPVAGTSNQIVVSWTAPSGATSYKVDQATAASGPWTTVAPSVASTSYTDSGLTANTPYWYQVTASNSTGSSVPSTATSATTNPGAPGGLVANPVSFSQIDLSWTAPSGGTSYRVERAVGSGTFSLVGTAPGTSYSDTGLSSSTTYSYRVSAAGATATSSGPYSATATATTQAGPPSTPSGVTAAPVTGASDQVRVAWSGSAGATSYAVERGSAASGPWTPRATGVTSTSYTDTGLSPNATFYYRVTASNATGSSAPSAPTAATTNPGPPGGLSARAASSSRIALSWTGVAGATSYRVERARGSGSFSFIGTATGTSFTSSGLSSSTTYSYRVTAVGANTSSFGPYSNTATATTLRRR